MFEWMAGYSMLELVVGFLVFAVIPTALFFLIAYDMDVDAKMQKERERREK